MDDDLVFVDFDVDIADFDNFAVDRSDFVAIFVGEFFFNRMHAHLEIFIVQFVAIARA